MLDEIDYSKYDDDVSVLGLDTFILNYLQYDEIYTVGNLLQYMNTKQLKFPNVGPVRIAEITAALLGYLTNKMENCIC